PDGKHLVSTARGNKGGDVKVWDAQTGHELLSIKGGGRSGAFSPDGKRLASAGVAGVKGWDAQTGEERVTGKGTGGMVRSVVFSPDGTRLASGDFNGMVKIWDATSSPEARIFGGPTHRVSYNVAFSPDGKRMAGGSGTWDDAKQAYVSGELRV